MPAELNPVIRQKLEEFSQRWQGMILLRGVCEGLVVLLVSMTVVAILDWFFILPDAVRWTLSGLGYAATLGVVWWNCLRPLWRLPDARGLARMIEKAEPSLREDLISAVELGSTGPEQHFDSEVFRALIQDNVADRVQGLRTGDLLPARLISRWLYGASALVAVCAALLLVPGSPFGALLARALAPMANVERVSATKIEVIEPSPADLLAPRGDNLPVLVRITGPEPDKVTLEIFPHGDKSERERVLMSLVGPREFSATIPARAESLEYRIRAGDGVTRRFRIETRPRPQVIEFEKAYQPPAYAGLKPETVREPGGDLSALEGTEATLTLRLDQPVKHAELRLDLGARKQTIPLSTVGDRFTARVPLNTHGTYQVHLVAAATGFENKFSPQYEIRPLPDLVPRVSIDSPSKDLVVPPDEIIPLLGSAGDDVGLRSVAQHIRVNQGPWTQFPLHTNVQKEASLSRTWDLLPLGASPGDQITTKLVAVDVKGSKAESPPLTLHVSSPSFDARRLASLNARRRVQGALTELRDAANELDKALATEPRQQIQQGDDQQRQQAILNATAALEATEQKAAKAEEQLKAALPVAGQGREAADLALLGRALSQLQNETLPRTRSDLELAKSPSQPARDSAVRDLQRDGDRAAEQARNTEQAFRDLLAADEAAVAAANLGYLNREQKKINQLAKDSPADQPQTWERLARQQSGSAKEASLVEQTLGELGKYAQHGQGDRAKRIAQDLQKARQPLEASLTNAPTRALSQPSDKLRQSVEQALNNVLPMERELASHAERARERLQQGVTSAPELLERARKSAEELAAAERRLADMQAKKQPADPQAKKVAELQGQLARDWQAAAEQLKDRADTEELRRDADSQFVADAAKTAQALSAMRAATAGNQQGQQAAPQLKQLEEAFRTVDAGHRLNEAAQSLRTLAEQERWEAQSPDAATARPRDFEWLKKSLEQSPNELRKAKLPEDAARAAQNAAQGQPANQAREEMNRRQNEGRNATNPRPAQPVDAQLAAIGESVQQARQAAQPQIEAARQAIAQAAPSLSQMMDGLSRAAQQMEQTTRATAQSQDASAPQPNSQGTPPSESPQTTPANASPSQSQTQPSQQANAARANSPASPNATASEPEQLLGGQQNLNRQVDDLKDALRRDANVQDATSADARARARDADDAVAMLREPPAKAAAALREAVMAPQASTRQNALTAAAGQQQALADTLKQLAQHYRNLEAGKPEETRAELRQMEEQLGIKSALDAAYDRAQQLAELGQKTPQEMLAELERELATNETMRRELDNIADRSVDTARGMLENAAKQEGSIAQRLNELDQAQARKNAIMDEAKKIAEATRQLAADKLPPLRRDASAGQTGAEQELQRAEQSLQSAAQQAASGSNQSLDQAAKQMGEAVKGLQQANTDLKATETKAGQARQSAPPTEPRAAAAQAAQSQSAQAAQRAGELAQKAQQLAQQLNQLANQSGAQMAQAAGQQPQIAQNLDRAGSDLERAGRHETRLGTPQGMALQQVGQQTQKVGGEQVPQAQSALNNRENPQAAQQAVQGAQQAMQQQLNELAQAMQMTANKAMSSGAQQQQSPSGQPGEQGQQQGSQGQQAGQQGGQASAEESRQMARTLDRIDAALNPSSGQGKTGQQGQQQGQQGQPQSAQQAAQQAMAQAAQAQQAAMRAQRQGGNVPGQPPPSTQPGSGDGAEMVATDGEPGELPYLQAMKAADWAKLPPKVAQGLLEAQREGTAAEYRTMVETYFRVIAERAKKTGL
jgi:hypothetical protein